MFVTLENENFVRAKMFFESMKFHPGSPAEPPLVDSEMTPRWQGWARVWGPGVLSPVEKRAGRERMCRKGPRNPAVYPLGGDGHCWVLEVLLTMFSMPPGGSMDGMGAGAD